MTYIDRKNAINVVNNNIYGDDISTIRINGMPFRGVARGSSLAWDEFTWTVEPTRTIKGAFENIDTIDVLLVSRCEINFKYMNIQDFMKFREAIKQRYFYCTFFNVDTGEWEYDREMYCSGSEREELYYFNPELLGVINFSIKLVATNRDSVEHEPITITYDKNGYDIITKSDTAQYSEQYVVENGPELAGYTFQYWTDKVDQNRNAIGFIFKAGQSFTAFKDKTLYAIYKGN